MLNNYKKGLRVEWCIWSFEWRYNSDEENNSSEQTNNYETNNVSNNINTINNSENENTQVNSISNLNIVRDPNSNEIEHLTFDINNNEVTDNLINFVY